MASCSCYERVAPPATRFHPPRISLQTSTPLPIRSSQSSRRRNHCGRRQVARPGRRGAVGAPITPNKPSVILSQPDSPKLATGSLIVEAVEIEPGGKFYGSTGATVRVYLNDSFIAPVTTGAA